MDKQVFRYIQSLMNVEVLLSPQLPFSSRFMNDVISQYDDCGLYCIFSEEQQSLLPMTPSSYEFCGLMRQLPFVSVYPLESIQQGVDRLKKNQGAYVEKTEAVSSSEATDVEPVPLHSYTLYELLKRMPMLLISNHTQFFHDNRQPLKVSHIHRLDELLRRIREQPDRPFGGVQVVCFNFHPGGQSIGSPLLHTVSLNGEK